MGIVSTMNLKIRVGLMDKQLHGKARKRQKQEEAIERQTDRESRTPEQQLKVIDNRFGEGVGAKRERHRLVELIVNQSKKHKKKSKKKKQ